jgi:TonB family protein
MMGSTNGEPDEKPAHQVTINYSFYMGRYEVTQAQWQAVMGNNPSYFKDCGGNCPVEQVSWDDTQIFIQRLNGMNDGYTYRLPTEAEWEYACRAGTTGDYAGPLSEMAWYSENSGSKTHTVGGKRPNEWGLADMHGNVWELCQDWYHETYYGAPTDGSAWLSGGDQKYRVLRGGSWLINATNLRSAYRNSYFSPDYRNQLNGFRVVAVARTTPNSSSTTPATVDADPVLFPKDTRNLQTGDPKSQTTGAPATEKVYGGKEVDQQAQILDKPKPFYTDSARTSLTSGTVVLRAVLASSGQVTNIRVISGLPNGLTEQAIAAAKRLKFTPAMKDGKAVSQEIQLEYNFSPY